MTDAYQQKLRNEVGLLPKQWSVNPDDHWYRIGPTPAGVRRFDKQAEPVTLENGGDAVLLVRLSDDSFFVDWILLEWCCGPSVKHDGSPGDEAHYKVMAQGSGCAGNLREPRHTYFNPDEDGYMFYLNFDALAWGIGILRQWLDF